MASPIVSLRLPDEDLRKLDELVQVSACGSRSALVASWIRMSYDRMQGSPELVEVAKQVKALQERLDGLRGSCDL